MRRDFGSLVLLALVALVVIRPWEHFHLGDPPPQSASAYVVRAIDGDTIEVRVGGRREDVRYIGMLSRVSRPHPSCPRSAFGGEGGAGGPLPFVSIS